MKVAAMGEIMVVEDARDEDATTVRGVLLECTPAELRALQASGVKLYSEVVVLGVEPAPSAGGRS